MIRRLLNWVFPKGDYIDVHTGLHTYRVGIGIDSDAIRATLMEIKLLREQEARPGEDFYLSIVVPNNYVDDFVKNYTDALTSWGSMHKQTEVHKTNGYPYDSWTVIMRFRRVQI